MDGWLKTGRLNSSKNVPACSPKESTENNILIEDVPDSGSVNTEDHSSGQTVQIYTNKRNLPQERTSSKKRKYDEAYLSFGFIPVGTDGNPDGQCIICKKIMCNSSLVPAKLKRHLETNHPQLKDKSLSFFERHKEAHQSGVAALHKYVKTDNENATEASFLLSYRIARTGKAHTIAEDLIKPLMAEIVTCMLGEKAAKKVATVQCSNNVVSDRIHKISDHIQDELISRLKDSTMFAIQLDESTDVAGLSILLVFVRYPFEESIEEDLFLSAPLETNTTGEEIFKVIDSYMGKHHIDWNKCIDVCSDGAAAMTGKIRGTVSRIKDVAPKCTSSHCVLHRHALVAKRISYDLKTVLDQAVQIVNYVKSRPLQSRLFKKVCEDIGSQHQSLLLHTEVRWLSRGRVLLRLFELRNELNVFFANQSVSASVGTLVELLHDEQWLIKLAYLANIFDKLNLTCKALQGKTTTIFTVNDNMSALKTKISFWIECVDQHNYECFPILNGFLIENNLQVQM